MLWHNVVTVPCREIMCLSHFPCMVREKQNWIHLRRTNRICGQVSVFWTHRRCPGASAADYPCLWICGREKLLDIAAASLVTQPAIDTLLTCAVAWFKPGRCSDLAQTGQATGINSILSLAGKGAHYIVIIFKLQSPACYPGRKLLCDLLF